MMNKIFYVTLPLLVLSVLAAGCIPASNPGKITYPTEIAIPQTAASNPGNQPAAPVTAATGQGPKTTTASVPNQSTAIQVPVLGITPASPAGFSLSITEPASNSAVSTAVVTMRGRTGPGAVVSSGSEITVADSRGEFAMVVNLMEGPNVIQVIASDASGNTATASLIVIYDK